MTGNDNDGLDPRYDYVQDDDHPWALLGTPKPKQPNDRCWEQGFQDGQTSALTDLNLLETKIRNEVLDEMVKLSTMIETEETERWESVGRPKNDGYINGSHSGYGHALRDMRQWIDRIKMANGGMKV